jgi:hypothetical protein
MWCTALLLLLLLLLLLKNLNMEPAKILTRLRTKFDDDETLSRTRCMAGLSHLKKAEQRLKTCEEYTYCREGYG